MRPAADRNYEKAEGVIQNEPCGMQRSKAGGGKGPGSAGVRMGTETERQRPRPSRAEREKRVGVVAELRFPGGMTFLPSHVK